LENPERQMEMAIQNFSAALRMSMPEIIRQYLRTFNLQQQLGLLASVSRLRRLPRWLPLRPRLARLAARRFLGRLPVSTPPASVADPDLLDRKSDQSRDVLIPGISVDRDLESSNRPANSGSFRSGDPTAAGEEQTAHQNRPRKQSLTNPLPSGPATGDGQPRYAEARQKQGVAPPAAVPIMERQGGHASGNSQSGTDSMTSRNDRGRRERADGSRG